MILFPEADYWGVFCADSKCSTLDSNASKALWDAEYAKRQQKDYQGRAITGAKKFCMGSLYENASLSKWISTAEEQKKVLSWFTNNKPFLVFLGKEGSGKSYLAAAVLNHFFENHIEIQYTTHRRFKDDLILDIHDKKPSSDSIKKYVDKKVLIIDDLGAATNTDWQQEMILDLIDSRYSYQKKTLITSNFTRSKFREKLGERTASRVFDQKNELLECWDIDRRGIEESAW